MSSVVNPFFLNILKCPRSKFIPICFLATSLATSFSIPSSIKFLVITSRDFKTRFFISFPRENIAPFQTFSIAITGADPAPSSLNDRVATFPKVFAASSIAKVSARIKVLGASLPVIWSIFCKYLSCISDLTTRSIPGPIVLSFASIFDSSFNFF